jgi:hypothetical protein
MVLTEDSSKESFDTVRALAREMLKLLVPRVQTDRIGFKPLEDESARRAVQANLWKSTRAEDRPSIILLIRTIINELLKTDGFVLYHIDGDRPWSQRTTSDNVRQFQKLMLAPIREGLREVLSKRNRPEVEHAERLTRLRLLVPYYSIEAWLYQNTQEAARICEEEGCKRCRPMLEAWAQARASLDEVVRPKDVLCLRDKYNAHLASSGFPADEVYAAESSFAQVVEELLDCSALTSALEQTYAAPEP